MIGWLIVNSFIDTKKFNDIYNCLKNSSAKYNVELVIKKSSSILPYIEDGFKTLKKPDFVLFWDKDVYLLKQLEMLGVNSFNSSSAISVCDNKILTYLALKGKVALPKTIVAPKTFEGVNYSDTSFISDAIALLNTPFIIKEACGSFGKQVYLANDLAEAENIVKNLNYKEFLMQEFIKTSVGKDVRINVVGGKVVSAILRTNEKDFRSNISSGGKGANYTPTKKEADLAIKVTNLLGLDFSGVDVLFGENDTPILCEVNSNPHFKSSLDITGVDMGEEIIKYIIGKLK